MSTLQFRNITLAFEAGNLLDRTDDAVAISCDKGFSLRNGLGKAFADKGDQQFNTDVQQLRTVYTQIANPIAIAVRGSGLNCQNLILVPLRQYFGTRVDEVFNEILQCATQLGAQSLALPPIGTGGFGFGRAGVAEAMKTTLENRFNYGSITRITIVDMAQHTVDYYHNVLANMVADDLLNNPNLYLPTANNPNQGSDGSQRAGPSNPASSTPFATFYKALNLDQLKELRQKREDDRMEIDTPNRDSQESLEACPVCLIDLLDLPDNYDLDSDSTVVQLSRCIHKFHRQCLVAWFQNKPQCPICNRVYMRQDGNQPRDGRMRFVTARGQLPGFQEPTHLRLTFTFPDGVQTADHPRPGVRYKGIKRVCYLPDTPEGQEVSRLLREAFNRHLMFTVGDSVTTGQQNVVTYNGIHLKTSQSGGPANYGYPDPNYLGRVKQELASVGVVPPQQTGNDSDSTFNGDSDSTDDDD